MKSSTSHEKSFSLGRNIFWLIVAEFEIPGGGQNPKRKRLSAKRAWKPNTASTNEEKAMRRVSDKSLASIAALVFPLTQTSRINPDTEEALL
jgi:hypothetical protein